MTENCTVVRHNDRLQATLDKCQEWKDRYKRVKLSDTGMWTNQNLSFARATRDMLLQSEAVLRGALARDESRGAHYKPAFPDRDDARFLKATIATYNPATDDVDITYGPVDTSLVKPRPADVRQDGRQAGHRRPGRRPGPGLGRGRPEAGAGRRLNEHPH